MNNSDLELIVMMKKLHIVSQLIDSPNVCSKNESTSMITTIDDSSDVIMQNCEENEPNRAPRRRNGTINIFAELNYFVTWLHLQEFLTYIIISTHTLHLVHSFVLRSYIINYRFLPIFWDFIQKPTGIYKRHIAAFKMRFRNFYLLLNIVSYKFPNS